MSVWKQPFIPLPSQSPLPQKARVEESFQDYIQFKTGEYNTKLRMRPKDQQLWLDYVAFQDQVWVAWPLLSLPSTIGVQCSVATWAHTHMQTHMRMPDKTRAH